MKAEAIHWTKCLNPRCPVKHWPSTVSEGCPKCGLSGFPAGVVVKVPDPPKESQ